MPYLEFGLRELGKRNMEDVHHQFGGDTLNNSGKKVLSQGLVACMRQIITKSIFIIHQV